MQDQKKENHRTSHPSGKRLERLRAVLRDQHLDGFIVPNTDDHQGEYTPAYRERLAFLSCFKGTAGLFIVLEDRAALFVDGRYILQAQDSVDPDRVDVYLVNELRPTAWLKSQVGQGKRIGFDPWTLTENQMKDYQGVLADVGAHLVPVDLNPVDRIWNDQPAPPFAPVKVHPVTYAGEAFDKKVARLQEGLMRDQLDAFATSSLESIAWLLNIRGGDLDVFPVVLAHMIVPKEGAVQLFVDAKKIDSSVLAHFKDHVVTAPYEAFMDALAALGQEKKRVLIDPYTNAVKLILAVEGADAAGGRVVRRMDPTLMPKACKNPVEVEGARRAHVRDGAALVNFLAWLSRSVPTNTVDEQKAASQLLAYRKEQELFQSVSFETISSSGPHGAVVHYRVTPETNRPIHPHDIYLVDSGGQYLDGTTDVTRTVCFMPPSAEQKDRFTRVLQGHIDLARARFVKGTTGSQLDCLARPPLGRGLGLCPWYRAWGWQLFRGARRATAHFNRGIPHCLRARHDPFKRTWLL
jgi:Xaa-Pro aminopeptidase